MKTLLREEEKTAPLAERLRLRIIREGALSFRDWMEAALYDEREGYYARGDLARWGRAGDYRTSPEVSPLFAATFARCFATLYEELGAPREWHLIEAGAGAGHFARVVLETLERDFPRVFDATRYLIDEASADARERSRASLAPYEGRVEFRRLREILAPLEAGLIFSNELFDALPVHLVKMRGGHLRELCVGLDAEGSFAWVEREPETLALAEFFENMKVTLAEGQTAEVCLDAERWLADAARVLSRGFLISVDYGVEAAELYGAAHRREGTLRAFSGHRLGEDVLARPGQQDLTYTVNWTHLRAAGERAGWRTVSLERQDSFLMRAGLVEQLERLTERAASEAERVALRLGAREMILPGGISGSFQVLVQSRLPDGSRL